MGRGASSNPGQASLTNSGLLRESAVAPQRMTDQGLECRKVVTPPARLRSISRRSPGVLIAFSR
jgi:hypothetical protein